MGAPIIETTRLLLRQPQACDFDAYADMHQDAEAMRFIGGVAPRAAAWRKFLVIPGAWAIQGFAMFSVVDKASGAWLGHLGPWQPEGWPGTEIGWAFHPRAWGNGYATEAGHAALTWAFQHLGWSEVIHSISPDNVASQQLAKRLGSTNSGPGRLPEPFESERIDIWRQSREQWARSRQAAGAAAR